MEQTNDTARTEGPAARLPVSEQQDLVLRYAPLVRRIARSLPVELPGVIDYEDAVGYGMCGLIEAVRRYDPSRGNSFHTYATRRVRGAMLDAFRRMDSLSRTMRQRTREVRRAQADLQSALGRKPSDTETANHLGLTPSEFRRAAEQGRWRTVSLDHLLDGADTGDGFRLLDSVASDNGSDFAGTLEQNELEGTLARAIRLLPERERAVIALYYVEELTMKEIARALAVSETRISQLHGQALGRLRRELIASEAA